MGLRQTMNRPNAPAPQSGTLDYAYWVAMSTRRHKIRLNDNFQDPHHYLSDFDRMRYRSR